MSRGKKRKRPGWQERKRRQERADEHLFDDVAEDTAAKFTCSTRIAEDFAEQCQSRLDELEAELEFNRVAVEMWDGRPGGAVVLSEALAALRVEREREREALMALRARFDALSEEGSYHEHLDPVDQWRAFVRKKLFPDAPTD